MIQRAGLGLLGVGLGVVVVLVGFSGVAVASTPIGACTTIDTAGGYHLTGDISNGTADPCIEISASDVEFDGAGYTIDGAGSGTGTGIAASGASPTNITVTDVTVSEFQHGIRYESVAGSAITSSTVTNMNGIGVLFRSTGNTSVASSSVSANGRDGIRLISSSAVTLDTVQSTGNSNHGVNIASGSTDTAITGSTVAGNSIGIGISGASDNTHVDTTTVENNSLYGVSLEGVDGTHLEDVTATDNGVWAFHQAGDGVATTESFDLDSAIIDTTSRSIALGGIAQPTSPPSGMSDVNGHINATDTGASAYVLLNVSYASPAGTDESTLRLWRHDGSWTQLPAPNGVDTINDYVYANITSFPGPPAEYAAIGDNSTTPPATPMTPIPTPTPSPTPSDVVTTPTTPSTPQDTPTIPTPVDDCMDIVDPGTYVLNQDLQDRPEAVCIDILVDDVTFDGNGYTIESDNSSSTAAIRALGSANGSTSININVQDVTVEEWHRGVKYDAVQTGEITGITSTNQMFGVAVENSSSITVSDIDGTDSGGSSSNAVWWYGNTILFDDVSDSTIQDVSMAPETIAESGITISHSDHIEIVDIAFDSDAGAGVLISGSNHVSMETFQIEAGQNTWEGIGVADSSELSIQDGMLADVGLVSVVVADSENATFANVTTMQSDDRAFQAEDSSTNITLREFQLGAATAPTTVDADGDRYNLDPVPAPPADPGGEQNLSRYVEITGNTPAVLVNVTYTVGDVSTANVSDTTIDPWIYDGSWSQATGTAGTDTSAFHVYAEITTDGVILAPLGEADSGASISDAPGFGPIAVLIALLAALIGLTRRP